MSEVYQLTDTQIKELIAAAKHDPASTAHTGGQWHGVLPAGNFGPLTYPGVRPEMYGAMVRPRTLRDILGAPLPADTENEIVEIMTGVTEVASCTNVTGWCGDPPLVAGNMKVCQQVIPFGKYYGKTHLVQIPEVGKRKNRADMERILLSEPAISHPFIPDLLYRVDNSRSALQAVLWEFGQGAELTWERVTVTGNSAQASAQTECGWWKEYDGLDQLVTTGYTDAVTSVACPAADSRVITWNAGLSATDAYGRYVDEVFGDLMYYLEQQALSTGNAPATFVVIMRSQVFRQFAQRIACTFATSGCINNATNTGDPDRMLYRQTFEAMMNGQFLLANSGTRYPVVFSDGIELTRPSEDIYVSDLYVVPVTVKARRVFFYEYFPMDNQFIMEYTSFGGKPQQTFNNGLWGYYERDNGACMELSFVTQGRLRLDTPWLAGRIDGIRYTAHTEIPLSPYADETFLYKDGGQTQRVSP